jgi:Zn finger protein HypA/HybF involved in hydrogenase expression
MPRLIDADALTAEITVLIERNSKFIDKGLANLITDAIEETPTVDAKPVKHGHWRWHGSYYTCSVCGEEQYGVDTGRYYCPNCGAKMDEVEDDT